ncbi:MAG: VWA domain-containing protein [Candidatus Brocadiia bacterium]
MFVIEKPLALLLVAPLAYLWWRLGRGPRSAWPLRIAMIVLCVLLLAGPGLKSGAEGRRLIFLVDRSLSAGDEALQTGREMVKACRARKRDNDTISVVSFGDGANVVSAVELAASSLDDSSDLHAGLRLASALCGDRGGRVFVISDGLFTGPEPSELVGDLHKQGVVVDYWPITKEREMDAAVTAVRLPERIMVGHPFEIEFSVFSPSASTAKLRITTPQGEINNDVELSEGKNNFSYRDVVPHAGLAQYAIDLSVSGDTIPENNHALAVTEAVGPPAILLVNTSGAPDNLSRALQTAGMGLRICGEGTAITSAGLKPFSIVVLENVSLSAFNDKADAALRNYVREMGGGLLITGGENSFAAGGYYRSRLEKILPVSMEKKEHYRRPPLAMGIVLDRSGSMGMSVKGGLQKMDLANRGAAEAVRLLAPQDQVSVHAVDSQAHKVVGLTLMKGNRERIERKILSIESMGGGIFVHTGLAAAVRELTKSKAPNRHIVLFADAADSEEPQGCRPLIKKWQQGGNTLSVIGLGTKGDRDSGFLTDLAKIGGGRVFFTTDSHSLPRVFCQDAMRVARRTFIEQKTDARMTPSRVMFGQTGIKDFPSINGYNLCYDKQEAATVVRTIDENNAPVLAIWRRGLGRVAAFTAEADGPYSGELALWKDYKPFLSSVAKWLKRERQDIRFFGSILREGRTATVTLEMDSDVARKCPGATAMIIGPDESRPAELPLQWVSPRKREVRFKLTSTGVYHGIIRTGGGQRVSLPPVVLPYSPEFERVRAKTGAKTLKNLAEETDGGRIMHVDDLFSGKIAGRKSFGKIRSLVPILSIVLLVVMLCEITTRKALWRHLIPERIWRVPGRLRLKVGGWWQMAKRRMARRRARKKREHEPPEKATGEEKKDKQVEESDQEKDSGQSVFEEAKKRSRQ